MSVDIGMYRKNSPKVLTTADLDVLNSDFDVIIDFILPESDKVISFRANPKDEKLKETFGPKPQADMKGLTGRFTPSFNLNADGIYWTTLYNYSETNFWNAFVKVYTQIAKSLNMLIEDPQSDTRDITPEEFLSTQTTT